MGSHIANTMLTARGDTYADKVKQNLEKLKDLKAPRKPLAYQRRGRSRNNSRSRSRSRTSSYRRKYRSRSRSRSGRGSQR